MKPVLVSGSLAYDRIMDFAGLFADHFIADKLHNINVSFVVDRAETYMGGTAGNIAYSLGLLGTSATILSTAGKDFGALRAHLESVGVDCAKVQVKENDATALATIMTDKGDNQISSFYPGASAAAYVGEIPEASLAIVAPGGLEDMEALPKLYKERNIPYLFDPGQRITHLSPDMLRNGIEGSAGILANDYEFAVIQRTTLWSSEDILAKTGFVIVTLGAEGSRILTRDGEERVGAVAAREVKDPTGAGDAFRAGVIAGYVRSLPLRQCAMLGSTVAVYAVECYGTQNHTFTLPELNVRYEDAYQEPFPL